MQMRAVWPYRWTMGSRFASDDEVCYNIVVTRKPSQIRLGLLPL